MAMRSENDAYDDQNTMRRVAGGFHTHVATLFLHQGNFPLAETHLVQAIHIAPNDAIAQETLASLFAQTGRPAEARRLWEELVKSAPTNALHHMNLGTVLLQLKEYVAAEAELKRSLELDGKQAGALNNLARLYLGSRREPLEALRLCQRLVDVQPKAANYDLLGWAFFANGQTNDARASAAQAVALDPTNAVYRERLQRLGK
jgi:Flp pilus assembly protein TadD